MYYLYTGKLDGSQLNIDYVIELYEFARNYKLDELQRQLIILVDKYFEHDTWMKVAKFACHNQIDSLIDIVAK